MHQRALLILIGGRQTPNVLTAQFLKPDLIVPIASHEAMRPGDTWSKIVPVLKQLCPDGVLDPIAIDAFDPIRIQAECEKVLANHRDATWWINITCGTTLMSLGVSEAAKKFSASSVWYLDSNHRKVITLQGNPPDGDVFRLTVSDYLTAFQRRPKHQSTAIPTQESLNLARIFAQRPYYFIEFKKLLHGQKANALLPDQDATLTLPSGEKLVKDMCRMAKAAGLLNGYLTGFDSVSIQVVGPGLWEFVAGKWLEYLVWDAARKAGCFDDIRMSVEIPGQFGLNELDLAATVSANLLIAECKTDANPFISKAAKDRQAEHIRSNPGFRPEVDASRDSGTAYLDKLNSIAGLIGGSFVTKLFICSQRAPDPVKKPWMFKPYESFIGQAKERQIVVITGDQLDRLPALLREQAERPTYSRT